MRPVLVFAPVAFEAVRFELLDAPGRSERERARDALWQSCTSLAGLRPEEAWALQPDFFRERTIAVVQAVAHGEIKRTKEDEWHYPPLHPVLREELDAYLERWPVEFGQLIFDDPALPGKPIADHNSGRVLAAVVGEVALVAVDHRQAGAHAAGEVEGGGADGSAKVAKLCLRP